MGWNTTALFARGKTLEDVLEFLPDVFEYEPTGKTVPAEKAWGRGGKRSRLYAREQEPWCQLWDPHGRFLAKIAQLAEEGGDLLEDTQVLVVAFDSVGSTYRFWLYDDGELVRKAHFASGKTVAEVGEPLAAERGVAIPTWGHDEDFLWTVITAVTGFAASDDRLEYAEIAVSS